jgi:hypothetical protein
MRLIAHRIEADAPILRPAAPRRAWMDEITNKFIYRCLPVTIGSQYGWELLCPCSVEAVWNGGKSPEAITIVHLGAKQSAPPYSHFGEGVLTFHPGYLFRTPSPYQMMVTGPINSRKDGIVPLTGVVETDWLPYTFTMNWIFTRVGVPVRFEEGEPFCQIFPLSNNLIEQVEPEIVALESEPELHAHYHEWEQSRRSFNAQLADPESEAKKRGWQRFYNRATLYNGQPVETQHRTRLAVRPFVERVPVDPSPGAATPSPAPEREPATASA